MKRILAILLIILLVFTIAGCKKTPDFEEEISRTRVGISWCEDIDVDKYGEDLQAYIDAVEKAGGKPVLLPLISSEEEAEELLKAIDVLIMTGGEDIDPAYYNEEPDPNLEEVNKERDVSDFALLKVAIEKDFPVLAICRGCQLLNVITGGTLYQDLPTGFNSKISHRDPEEEDFAYHDITIEEDTILAGMLGTGPISVNSWHHQGIKDLGDGLIVTATAEDGLVEAIQKEWAPCIIGVQFHPEWHVDDGDDLFQNIFYQFFAYAK